MKHTFTILLPLTLLLLGCQPQPVAHHPTESLTLQSTCSPTNLTIGEIVELTITATHPTGTTLHWPELGRKKEILQRHREWEATLLPDSPFQQTRIQYHLTSLELGTHLLTTNLIRFTQNNTETQHPFPNHTLHVQSSLPPDSDSQLAPLRPPQPLPTRFPRWLLILLLTALIAYLLGRLSTRLWKNRDRTQPAPPPIPPHLTALRALEELHASPLHHPDQSNPYITQLSAILRTYLDQRFHLNAPDQTTEELLIQLTQSPSLTGHQRNVLNQFLQQADLVKFARGHLELPAMDDAFQTARNFIQETAQHPTGDES